MKLGIETASLSNVILSQNKNQPVAGQWMTQLMWTDRRVWKVLEVSETGKSFTAELYHFTRDFYDGYGKEYTPTGNVASFKFTYGKWRIIGVYGTSPVNLAFNRKDGYCDPHF